LKLAFITVAASLLGGALVAASTSADGRITTKLQDRAPIAGQVETVRVVDVSCAGAPGARPFATPASFGPFGPEGPEEADHPTLR
jgi:hypothetical protein